MRRLICLGIVAAAVLAIPTAQAVTAPPSRSTSRSSRSGTATAPSRRRGLDHEAGVSVDVYARAFTRPASIRSRTVMTGKGGAGTTRKARHRDLVSGPHRAPTRAGRLLVGVRPAITMTQLDNGRLGPRLGRALVRGPRREGAEARRRRLDDARAAPSQRQVERTGPEPLAAGAVLDGARAISVNQAGQGYLAAFSADAARGALGLAHACSTRPVAFGDAATLTAAARRGRPGCGLTILARPAAKPEFQPLASLTTGTGGTGRSRRTRRSAPPTRRSSRERRVAFSASACVLA